MADQNSHSVIEKSPEQIPPATAERLLSWLASPTWDEAVLGDFLEMYARKFMRTFSRYGLLLAKLDYWRQVLRSAPAFLRIRLRRSVLVVSVQNVFMRPGSYVARKLNPPK